jgi:hypothetical protein
MCLYERSQISAVGTSYGKSDSVLHSRRIQAAGQVERANRNRQGAGVSCRDDEKVRITSDMRYKTQDRRQHPRTDDALTKIEDLTYSVLRKSIANERDATQRESARIRGGLSHPIFLLVPFVAVPIIAILFARACLVTTWRSPKN